MLSSLWYLSDSVKNIPAVNALLAVMGVVFLRDYWVQSTTVETLDQAALRELAQGLRQGVQGEVAVDD